MDTSTKFAPVGPLVAQRRLAEEGVLGDYQLLIAPVIIRQLEAYHHFYNVDYPGQHIIVDNGVVELGYPLPPDQLYLAATAVGAQVVVIPDTIDDAKMTVKQARKALPEWRTLSNDIQALGVAQGRTLEECIECARILVEEGIDWLAASKYSAVNLGSRVELVKALGEFGKPVHVLGFSDNLADDMLAATAHPMVRGIDAATPLWSPKAFPPVPPLSEDDVLDLGRRPKDFWTMPAALPATFNVLQVREWLKVAAQLHPLGLGGVATQLQAIASNAAKGAPTDQPGPAHPKETSPQT